MSDNTQSADTQSKHTLLEEVRAFFKSLEGVAEEVVQKVEDFIEGKKAEIGAADDGTGAAADADVDGTNADAAGDGTETEAAPGVAEAAPETPNAGDAPAQNGTDSAPVAQ